MKYRSKPTEIEAMQWYSGGDAPLTERCAREIVAWVNANGGEAKYVPIGENITSGWSGYPRIAVHTINGWAYAAPGHYVVMGSATFDIDMLRDPKDPRCAEHNIPDCVYCPTEAVTVRDFYPCDPETFEQRWEPQS